MFTNKVGRFRGRKDGLAIVVGGCRQLQGVGGRPEKKKKTKESDGGEAGSQKCVVAAAVQEAVPVLDCDCLGRNGNGQMGQEWLSANSMGSVGQCCRCMQLLIFPFWKLLLLCLDVEWRENAFLLSWRWKTGTLQGIGITVIV